MSQTIDRVRLHQLVDALSERDLNEPQDDEPITKEDILAQAEADADIAAGRDYSHQEAGRILSGEG